MASSMLSNTLSNTLNELKIYA